MYFYVENKKGSGKKRSVRYTGNTKGGNIVFDVRNVFTVSDISLLKGFGCYEHVLSFLYFPLLISTKRKTEIGNKFSNQQFCVT